MPRNKNAKSALPPEPRPETPRVIFFLLVVLFSLHLVCVNLAAGGLLVASGIEIFAGRGTERAAKLSAKLASHATLGLLAGAALGGLMLLFFWNTNYQDIFLRRLGTRPAFSLVQVAFSLALHTIQWRWTKASVANAGAGRYWRALIGFISSTNLIYHFPTLFAIVAEIVGASNSASPPIERRQFYAFLASGPILSHAAHFFLAALATAGVTGAIFVREEPAPASLRRFCSSVALICTVFQIPVGIMVYMTLPATAQRGLIGENMPLSVAFLASLASALWLMQSLIGQLHGDIPKNRPIWSGVALLTTILLMSGVLWGTRKERFSTPPSAKQSSASIASNSFASDAKSR